MKNYTIVKKATETHYDTNDQRFYDGNWERTEDTREYLKQLIKNNPEKFEGCKIQKN